MAPLAEADADDGVEIRLRRGAGVAPQADADDGAADSDDADDGAADGDDGDDADDGAADGDDNIVTRLSSRWKFSNLTIISPR